MRKKVNGRFQAVILIALSIFMTLGCVEGFFQANEHWHWMAPWKPHQPKLSDQKTSWVREQMQSPLAAAPAKIIWHYPSHLSDLEANDLDRSQIYVKPFEFENHVPQRMKLTTLRGESIYEFTAEFEPSGRRRLGGTNRTADQFLFAIGDSFTFGIGVNGDDAYPSQLARRLSTYQVYNMGWGGWGPNDILYQLTKRHPFYFQDVSQRQGSVIYLFLPVHLERMIPGSIAFQPFNQYFLKKPRYEIDATTKPVYRGTYETDRTFTNFCLKIWSESAFLRYFRISWPLYYTEYHYQLFSSIMRGIRTSFEQSFKINNFYVVIWPGTPRAIAEHVYRDFMASGFIVLDYSSYDVWSAVRGNATIPIDGHPTPETYWLMTQLMQRAIIARDH